MSRMIKFEIKNELLERLNARRDKLLNSIERNLLDRDEDDEPTSNEFAEKAITLAKVEEIDEIINILQEDVLKRLTSGHIEIES